MKILITGASRGIGLGLCDRYLAEGASVFAACRNPDKADHLTKLAERYPETLKPLRLDVTSEESLNQALDSVSQLTDHLDLLINNAGVKYSETDFEMVTAEALQTTFAANISGPIMVSKIFMPLLLAAEFPKLANISSQLGSLERAKHWGYYSYNCSKAALNMFTRMLADDQNYAKVSVFSIHPGWVRTDLGGQSAPVSVKESVDGMLGVFCRPGAELNGRFFTFEGVEHPW